MMKSALVASVVSAMVIGCVSGSDAPPQELTSDGGNGGTAGFFWLPTFVDTMPTFTGPFDGTYKTRSTVDIADVDCTGSGTVGAVVKTFGGNAIGVNTTTERYKVTFNVGAANGLVTGNCYRVIAKLDGAALGYRDVAVVARSGAPVPFGYRRWTAGANTTVPYRLENQDLDGDGVTNVPDNCDSVANPGQEDADGDGAGDACDVDDPDDTDGDGIEDTTDNCPLVGNADQADSDADGFGDACDVCPRVFDPLQENADGDFYGDHCDQCVDVAESETSDSDDDWVGDACDLCPATQDFGDFDTDGDGVGNACDNCPVTANATQADADADGQGDECDTDFSAASLRALVPSTGRLVPAFAPPVTSYQIDVESAVSAIQLAPTAADPGATITVDGVATTSGAMSAPIAIALGTNTIPITVTAAATNLTYTVVVVRDDASIATLSGLAASTGILDPAFVPERRELVLHTFWDTASITLTPTATVAGSTITVDGAVVASGTPSPAIALPLSRTSVAVVVTAPDGVTTTTYAVVVVRPEKTVGGTWSTSGDEFACIGLPHGNYTEAPFYAGWQAASLDDSGRLHVAAIGTYAWALFPYDGSIWSPFDPGSLYFVEHSIELEQVLDPYVPGTSWLFDIETLEISVAAGGTVTLPVNLTLTFSASAPGPGTASMSASVPFCPPD